MSRRTRDRLDHILTVAYGKSDSSVLAVRELEQMFSRKEALPKHAFPVIMLHLNNRNMIPLDSADWLTSPKIMNALSCFGMITTTFDTPGVSAELADVVWPVLQTWALYFIRRTRLLEGSDVEPRDLEVVSVVERVFCALTKWNPDYQRASPTPTSEELFQALSIVWLRCTSSLPITHGADLVHVVSSAIAQEAFPGRVGPISQGLASQPQDVVCGAIMACLIPLVTDAWDFARGSDAWRTRSVLMLLISLVGNQTLLPLLIESDILFWLARLAHRMTAYDQRRPRRQFNGSVQFHSVCLLVLFKNVHSIMIFGYRAIVRAAEARVLEVALRTEIFLSTTVSTVQDDDLASFRKYLFEIIDGLQHHLIYGSVLKAAQRDVKRSERTGLVSRLDSRSPLVERWSFFLSAVTSKSQQRKVYKHLTVYRCTSCRSATSLERSLKRCSKCLCTAYCSVACQRSDWTTAHKLECDAFSTQLETVMIGRVPSPGAIPRMDEEILLCGVGEDIEDYAEEIASAKSQSHASSLSSSAGEQLHLIQMDYRTSIVQITVPSRQECLTLLPDGAWRNVDRDGSDLVLVVTPYAPAMPAARLTTIKRLKMHRYGRGE